MVEVQGIHFTKIMDNDVKQISLRKMYRLLQNLGKKHIKVTVLKRK